MMTLDQAIDMVLRLPVEQQEMLVEIMQRRHIENRRKEIAKDAKISIEAFKAGKFELQSASDVITELHYTMSDTSEE